MANTNCNKIINVKYVKDFIGSDLKNDTGGTITVNSSYSNTAYCPTYKELTNGSLVQVFSSDDTKARNNKDGMLAAMNSSATYTQNQLIPQERLLKEYTRFNSFSISANKNSLPGSGGTINLSYTNQYVKHSFQMNSSCSVVDFSTIVYDTQDSGVTWNSSVGSISNKVLTVGANPLSSQRTIIVTGTTTFRGTSHTDTFTITQSAGTDCSKAAYVDLALPSGNLWAKISVGAETETDTGLLFQWGDVSGYTYDQVGTESGKKAFEWEDYKFGVGTYDCNEGANALNKYKPNDGRTQLESDDDAVVANWHDGGCIPTAEDYDELLTYGGSRILEYRNHVSGVTFKNDVIGTQIFFPIPGNAHDGSYSSGGTSTGGAFWSSNVGKSENTGEWCYNFGGTFAITVQGIRPTVTAFGNECRYYGLPIRAVKKNAGEGNLRFSNDPNMEYWSSGRNTGPSGATLDFYVWERRNNSWVAHNITNVQNELAFRSDDENITCDITSTSAFTNHCIVKIKFNGVDCNYVDTHSGFTMHIAPTACTEIDFVNGEIKWVFNKNIYSLVINTKNDEPYNPPIYHPITFCYSSTTRINDSEDGVCIINSSVAVQQRSKREWSTEGRFGFGEMLTITPTVGTNYVYNGNVHHYDSRAFSDIDIDLRTKIITMTFDPSRYID